MRFASSTDDRIRSCSSLISDRRCDDSSCKEEQTRECHSCPGSLPTLEGLLTPFRLRHLLGVMEGLELPELLDQRHPVLLPLGGQLDDPLGTALHHHLQETKSEAEILSLLGSLICYVMFYAIFGDSR